MKTIWLPLPVVLAIVPEYVCVPLVTIVNEPAVPVLLLAIVPPVPLNPPTARLNALRSTVPLLTVSGPVPMAPAVIVIPAPLPLVVDETPARSVPSLRVTPPLKVLEPARTMAPDVFTPLTERALT